MSILKKQIALSYLKLGTTLSFGFFALNEVITAYFKWQGPADNYWINYTLTGYLSFNTLHLVSRSRYRS